MNLSSLSRLLLPLFLGVITPAAAQSETSLAAIDFRSLFVEVSDQDSNFTVVDARIDETYAAGAFFGLLGAAVNSAANAAEDDGKADTLRAAAAEIDLKSALDSAIREPLAAHGAPPLAPDGFEASHTLRVEIRNWGLLRKNREDKEMRAFLNLTLEILDEKGHRVWRKERENAVSGRAAEFEAYTEDRFKSEMQELAEKSGRYIAYQIIYR